MVERRYSNRSTLDLRALAKEHWSDKTALDSIAHELGFRSKSAALALLAEIKLRLAELNPASQGSARGNSTGQGLGRASDDELQRLKRELDNEKQTGRKQRDEIARLRDELAAEKQRSQRRRRSAFSEVFLTEDVPSDILKDLQRAYQKFYHPDRYAEADKGPATEKFQKVQNAFAEILRWPAP